MGQKQVTVLPLFLSPHSSRGEDYTKAWKPKIGITEEISKFHVLRVAFAELLVCVPVYADAYVHM